MTNVKKQKDKNQNKIKNPKINGNINSKKTFFCKKMKKYPILCRQIMKKVL